VHSSQVIGPSLFGFTYVATVSTFPKAIFALSATVVASSMFVLAFVRLPDGAKLDEEREPMIRPESEDESVLI